MAAIVDLENKLDINELANGFKAHLPAYAVPIFVRVLKSVPLTGTFKLKKKDLQEEGFNVDKIKDTIYFYDPKQKKYTALSKETYNEIMINKIRL